MKRKIGLIFYCIILMLVCQVPTGVGAITEEQESAIEKHCDEIRDELREVQKNDARARVYLGGKYEIILSKYITPLNVRLVENSLSSAELVENQNDFAETKKIFADDYVNYQQGLEELVAMDCEVEPSGFYEKLVVVRQKRKIVEQDVLKLRSLISQHVRTVMELRSKV